MMRRAVSHAWWLLFALMSAAHAQDHSQHEAAASHHDHARMMSELAPHVPPDPPQRPMHEMSAEEMIELMEMDDAAAFFALRADSFEWRAADAGDVFAWDVQGWYGGDYTKLRIETEGDAHEGDVEARNELLVDRLIARWWSLQFGVRHDVHEGPSRSWAAFGVRGLAPYWFEVEATAYVGEAGRTALRLAVDYEVLLTQRLILQPEIELDVYGKADEENLIGSGLADAELALRLRYEIWRELAPYVGVSWQRTFGETADLARAAGDDRSELYWLAGVRWWF